MQFTIFFAKANVIHVAEIVISTDNVIAYSVRFWIRLKLYSSLKMSINPQK